MTNYILLGLFILLLFIENQRERNKKYDAAIKQFVNYWQKDIEIKQAILEELKRR